MADTHDYETRTVRGDQLNGTMTLVGESGGLSSIYETRMGSLISVLLTVETEHGMLLLDPETEHLVLNEGTTP